MVKMYVDGSYDHASGIYGFGIVAIYSSGEVDKYGGAGNAKKVAQIRNVAGEMLAAMHAVKLAIAKGYEKVKICYDYDGIRYWVTREWKAKNDLTIKYGYFMREMGNKIEISFEKVTAHTGDAYNEMADSIAKSAVATLKEKMRKD